MRGVCLAGLLLWACADAPEEAGDAGVRPDASAPLPDGAPADSAAPDVGPQPGLYDPTLAVEPAPETFTVDFQTSAGDFAVQVTRAWAPRGADRFYNLVLVGYYTDVAFFRVIDGFMAQTGISGDPQISQAWRQATIADDPNAQSNTRGRVTFATAGPDTRTTQIFFNYGDNSFLDDQGFAPFGEVVEMQPVDALYSGYGEGAPQGQGPEQGRIQREGNAYLQADFPLLDYILSAQVRP